MEGLEELQQNAARLSQSEHERQAEYFNASRREAEYKKGDLVWKRNRVLSSAAQGFAAKLAPKYTGPHLIIEEMGPSVYKIISGEGEIEEKVHAEHLKPYVEDEDEASELDEAEEPEPAPVREPSPARESPGGDEPSAPAPAEGAGEKRKRGRPRKQAEAASPPSAPEVEKRPRGRPRKVGTTTQSPTSANKPRGRPKKAPTV
ncbi:hypothetical protein JGE67_25550, partial [Salmonella enterica subsp. enterica serovar Typhimurium]|nr:hypothetical protein [Salmonella enterica subsp. enterica serovar Typhimurium]